MNPDLKRFLIILPLVIVITFPLFYFIEEDRNCVLDFGSKCSNSYFIRTSVQVVVMTVLFFYLGRKKTANKTK